MAENLSRFVIIDGVQIEKARARKAGLIDDDGHIVKRKGKVTPTTVDADSSTPSTEPGTPDAGDTPAAADTPSVDEPQGRRARGSDTARRG